jgi:CheY-like chemotaxis protein
LIVEDEPYRLKFIRAAAQVLGERWKATVHVCRAMPSTFQQGTISMARTRAASMRARPMAKTGTSWATDAVVLDLGLPEIDGLTVLGSLAQGRPQVSRAGADRA